MAPKTLPSRDLVRQLLRYDAGTGEFTWLPRPREMFPDQRTFASWNTNWAYKSAGYFKKHGYRYIHIAQTKYLAHRLAWLIHHGTPVPGGIDHINGESWDNSISNLRAATQAQNLANGRYRKSSITGARGVKPAHQKTGFVAQISLGNRSVHIGTFATIEEAAEARRIAAAQLRGAFARHD